MQSNMSTWTQCWSFSAGGSPPTIIWLSFTQFIWDCNYHSNCKVNSVVWYHQCLVLCAMCKRVISWVQREILCLILSSPCTRSTCWGCHQASCSRSSASSSSARKGKYFWQNKTQTVYLAWSAIRVEVSEVHEITVDGLFRSYLVYKTWKSLSQNFTHLNRIETFCMLMALIRFLDWISFAICGKKGSVNHKWPKLQTCDHDTNWMSYICIETKLGYENRKWQCEEE